VSEPDHMENDREEERRSPEEPAEGQVVRVQMILHREP
jgi:hypothetical protein